MVTSGKTDPKNKLQLRLAQYSVVAGASLIGANLADAGIIYSGPIDEVFGAYNAPYLLTMEGSQPEVQFFGVYESKNNGSRNCTTMNVNCSTVPPQNQEMAIGFEQVNNDFQVKGVVTDDKPSVSRMVSNQEVAIETGMFGERVNPGLDQGYFWHTNTTITTTSVPSFPLPIASTTTTSFGQWDIDGMTGYMGFSFLREEDSREVFGWAEIQRINGHEGRLLGWAYEDSGNPILTGKTPNPVPEPSTLAMLALGAAGLSSWRRRKLKLVSNEETISK